MNEEEFLEAIICETEMADDYDPLMVLGSIREMCEKRIDELDKIANAHRQ